MIIKALCANLILKQLPNYCYESSDLLPEKFETLFTNHLSHHETWENDIRNQMRWWVGVALTAATGSGAMLMGVI